MDIKQINYGYLYNWYAVNDVRGLAPVGWHVPTNVEWTTLTQYVFNNQRGSGSAAKALASKDKWVIDTGTNTIGNNLNINNSSGFSAFPGGFRAGAAVFYNINNYGYWWCIDEFSSTNALYRRLSNNSSSVSNGNSLKYYGHSVRCIKDNNVPTPGGITYDLDGNKYTEVVIGTQIWLVENLATTKYNDGSSIALVTDDTTWAGLITGGYTSYNNIQNYAIETISFGPTNITSIGIKQDWGVVPPMNRQSFSLGSVGVKQDWGLIPPKNYFNTTVQSVGVKAGTKISPRLGSFGIDVDAGIIPIMSRQAFKLNSFGVDVDFGVIPLKNYFKSSLKTFGIDLDEAPQSMMQYQVEPYKINTQVFAIGVDYLGGKIAYLDSSGIHGFVVSTTDISSGIQWRNGSFLNCNATYYDLDGPGVYGISKAGGRKNTDLIIATQGVGNYAASICANLTIGEATAGDWYLPSRAELVQIASNHVALGFNNEGTYYWSSSDGNDISSYFAPWEVEIVHGTLGYSISNTLLPVKAIRAF